MELIYGDVKQGGEIDLDKFGTVCAELFEKGCEKLILGCTELSLIKRKTGEDDRLVDSLEVLAHTAIKLCGKTPCGFGKDFE